MKRQTSPKALEDAALIAAQEAAPDASREDLNYRALYHLATQLAEANRLLNRLSKSTLTAIGA